jgi:hypothetical protein
MTGPLLYLVIAALAIYAIIRQFTKQQVTWRTLLLLPALSAYESYTEWQTEFIHFGSGLLLAGLALGLVLGVATGVYRGLYTRVHLDSASGIAFSKPRLSSSLTWVGLFVVRIVAGVLTYRGLDGTSMLVALLTIAASILFLASISTQKFIVYQKATRLRSSASQQFSDQRSV